MRKSLWRSSFWRFGVGRSGQRPGNSLGLHSPDNRRLVLHGQWRPGGDVTADNLGMVRGLTNQLRRSEYRSLRDDLLE